MTTLETGRSGETGGTPPSSAEEDPAADQHVPAWKQVAQTVFWAVSPFPRTVPLHMSNHYERADFVPVQTDVVEQLGD